MLDGFVVVYRAAGLAEAELIKGYLESEEIPTDLEYESVGPTYGFTMNGLGEVRVCVPTDYKAAAQSALAARPMMTERDLEEVEDKEPESAEGDSKTPGLP
jgi:hypothetical protein